MPFYWIGKKERKKWYLKHYLPKELKSVELINGEAGNYLPLAFNQNADGLTVSLPEHSFNEIAYVIKLSFKGKMPPLDMYAEIDCTPHYHIVPGDNNSSLVLGSDLKLTENRKDFSNQWKLEPAGKAIYKIMNRENNENVLSCRISGQDLIISDYNGNDNQLWKLDHAHNESLRISNKQFSNRILSVNIPFTEGNMAELLDPETNSSSVWKLMEVCEIRQEAFKPHTVPGIIEAEDFDTGCPDDAYYDREPENTGGKYRSSEGVDIEECSAGGYNIGWTYTGEWMAYTVTVKKSANYQISFYIASNFDNAKMHLECDGKNKTGILSIPNTSGFQSWDVVKKTIKLDAGQHALKLVVDGDFFNLDKMVFKEI
jgi:hypothetical protein